MILRFLSIQGKEVLSAVTTSPKERPMSVLWILGLVIAGLIGVGIVYRYMRDMLDEEILDNDDLRKTLVKSKEMVHTWQENYLRKEEELQAVLRNLQHEKDEHYATVLALAEANARTDVVWKQFSELNERNLATQEQLRRQEELARNLRRSYDEAIDDCSALTDEITQLKDRLDQLQARYDGLCQQRRIDVPAFYQQSLEDVLELEAGA